MSADRVSVTLALGAAPYQKTVATKLLSVGMLRQLIELVPYLKVREINGKGNFERVRSFPGYTLSKRVVWGVWRRLPESVRPRPPMKVSAWLADQLLAKWIVRCTIFHGYTALSLACLRAARKKGAITLVENAASHPRHWKEAEQSECQRMGVSSHASSGNFAERLLKRMEQEFAECDRIVVPSSVAKESFAEYGYGEKTVVVQTGVDADFFSPDARVSRQPSPLFRVCYVGRIEPAKGVDYLLQAWKRLGLSGAELVLVGEVRPQMKSLLQRYVNCGVRLAGNLPAGEVAQYYRESNLFVQPSLSEGLAQVLLEAMASGLPVVATDKTGAIDCITNGKEGLIVPARNSEALAEKILWCYENRAENQEMGRAARRRIESQFTLEHYNQRVVDLYCVLAKAYAHASCAKDQNREVT
jgi:glycosyltransferase involved in cell wall biosynthesis